MDVKGFLSVGGTEEGRTQDARPARGGAVKEVDGSLVPLPQSPALKKLQIGTDTSMAPLGTQGCSFRIRETYLVDSRPLESLQPSAQRGPASTTLGKDKASWLASLCPERVISILTLVPSEDM